MKQPADKPKTSKTEPVPLSGSQVAAAGALQASLVQWKTTDDALSLLRQALPGFGPTETLLKVVAVNALYGTNVLALMRAAKHVEQILRSADFAQAGPELVESLAEIPTTAYAKPRRYVSFASKFAHFFCNPERFPIFDSYAERMVLIHLGSNAIRNPSRPYEAFTTNLETLTHQYELTVTFRELDRYLWIAGLYKAYAKGDRRLNAELLHVFDEPTDDQRVLLRTLGGE